MNTSGSVTHFKSGVTETNVRFLCGFRGDLCLVNYAFHVTVSIHGAYVRFSTVAAFPSSIINVCEFPDFRFVVVRYDSFNAAHAAVAQFEGVPVENFVKRISFCEMLINKCKEAFSDVSFHVLAVWWVKPSNIPLPVTSWTWCLV